MPLATKTDTSDAAQKQGGATVSMQLTWSQVRTDLDPTKCTVRSGPRLLRTTITWMGYGDGERSIDSAIKRLGSAKLAA